MTDSPAPRLGFRADINGLRALAVLAVVAFHFGVPPFSGGFVGVDVFFVISGYLMTGIIIGRLDRGTFSIAGFYLDRARRIIPALAVLVAAVLILGVLILLPDEYLILSKHAATTMLFASNILYWKQLSYFGPGVEDLWLLHSWSLSVEWQFYLLYPVLLLGLRLAPRKALLPALAAVALASFACVVVLSRTDPQGGFFLLPPRAWEMLAGSLVFLSPPMTGRAARAAQLVGLAMILGAAVLTTSDSWPNAWALVPVAGTALVILSARTDSRITGNAVARWLGLNSYSIYLWHWPISVLLRRSGHFGEWPWIVAAIAVSLLLGHLSWRYVEKRMQPGGAPRIHTGPLRLDWRAHARFAAPVALLAIVSVGVWVSRGVPQRYSAEVLAVVPQDAPGAIVEAETCFANAELKPPCAPAGGAPTLAYFLGDSHVHAEVLGLIEALPPGNKDGLTYSSYAACPPVLGAIPLRSDTQCGAFLNRFLQPLAAGKRTTPLVLTGRWSLYLRKPAYRFAGGTPGGSAADFTANLVRSSCKLAAAGPVYIVLPTPEFPFAVTRELQRRLARDPHAPDITIPLSEHLAQNREIIEALQATQRCGVKLLDPTPYMCPNGTCQGSRDHKPLYRDADHVSDYGARLLTPMFAQVFAANPAK